MTDITSQPATKLVDVDVSSTDDSMGGKPCRYFYVGTAGDVALVPIDQSTTIVLENAAVGWHPVAVKEFKNSGTAASDIIAAYTDAG